MREVPQAINQLHCVSMFGSQFAVVGSCAEANVAKFGLKLPILGKTIAFVTLILAHNLAFRSTLLKFQWCVKTFQLI